MSSGFGAEPDNCGDNGPFGIEKRVPWTTSRITGSPLPAPPYRLERCFPKLQFKNPVVLSAAPGSERLFVVELNGMIYSFVNDDNAAHLDLFFDMKATIPEVNNVYGLAFHPNFAENRICYVCYRIGQDLEDGTRVSQFQVVRDDPPRIDPASEKILITWYAGGHNGGCLAFGPDGYLYISTGDGGPAFPPDPKNSGQDVTNLLSSVLRIDVNRAHETRPYSIPADNPFVDLPGARGEIWAYGFRNPWKMTFDAASGELWVGDVGWELWEMVYRVERGANYGWSLVEGPQAVHRERQRGPTPISPPTALHSHIESRSITGGYVYRGSRLPELAGQYIYGDYVTGKIWGLPTSRPKSGAAPVPTPDPQPAELLDSDLAIICFGVDHEQELYVVGYDGTIHRLERNDQRPTNTDFPTRLSDTGLFQSVRDHVVAPGVVPYSIVAEPWMDGATAQRFIALPGESQLDVHAEGNVQVGFIKDTWKFPTDAVLMKTISLETERGNPSSARRLETQVLHFDVDTWRAYNYIWTDDQSDAVLADDVASERVLTIRDPNEPSGTRQQTWPFASRTQCLLCHTTRGGSIYGFTPPQLDRPHDYGSIVDDQLRTLGHIGLFKRVAPQPAYQLANPYDATTDLEARARAYLHINCAHCHRRGGGGTAAMDVQYDLKLDKTNLLEARPTQGTFGIHAAQVLAAGDPYRSVLYYRMAKLGRGRMPYLGSSVVDQRGLELLHDWIVTLDSEPEKSDEARRAVSKLAREQLDTIQRSDQANRSPLVNQLLDSTTGALVLRRAVDQNLLPTLARDSAIQLGSQHADVQIRDLFEPYLPEERRVKRLGSVIDPAEILRLTGDTARGRALFFEKDALQCKNCHQVGGQGRAVGPDLTEIGKKYSPAQLLDSLIDPSRTIDPKYVTYLCETADGRVLTGVLVSKDEREVVLRDAQAQEIRLRQTDVDYLAPQQKSLMPDLQLADLTAQQVADLLAFLRDAR